MFDIRTFDSLSEANLEEIRELAKAELDRFLEKVGSSLRGKILLLQ
jgi:hypothetical protein